MRSPLERHMLYKELLSEVREEMKEGVTRRLLVERLLLRDLVEFCHPEFVDGREKQLAPLPPIPSGRPPGSKNKKKVA